MEQDSKAGSTPPSPGDEPRVVEGELVKSGPTLPSWAAKEEPSPDAVLRPYAIPQYKDDDGNWKIIPRDFTPRECRVVDLWLKCKNKAEIARITGMTAVTVTRILRRTHVLARVKEDIRAEAICNSIGPRQIEAKIKAIGMGLEPPVPREQMEALKESRRMHEESNLGLPDGLEIGVVLRRKRKDG